MEYQLSKAILFILILASSFQIASADNTFIGDISYNVFFNKVFSKNFYCTDNDNGIYSSVDGKVNLSIFYNYTNIAKQKTTYQAFSDSCRGNTLREYYCFGGKYGYAYEDVSCQYGCKFGVCVSEFPAKPESLSAQVTGNVVYLDILNYKNNGETGFRLYRKNSTNDFALIGEYTLKKLGIYPNAKTKGIYNFGTILDSSLQQGETYYYKARAYNLRGESQDSNVVEILIS